VATAPVLSMLVNSNSQIDKRILLCFSNTGGGHKSAALAVQAAIQEVAKDKRFERFRFDVVLADVIENSNDLHWLYVATYNFLLRYRQKWMKYYCRFIEIVKPDNSEICFLLAFRYAKKLLCDVSPAVVVSVHPMANYDLAKMLKTLNLKSQVKLIVVVTDPNQTLWSGWACPGADLIVAPNDLVADSLIAMGVDATKIETIGMPVNPKFLRPPVQSKASLLKELTLDPDVLTVCLSGGRAGGGNVASIYKSLLSVKRKIQVIVICGNNKKLTQQIREMSKSSPVLTAIVQNIPDMSDAMKACDLLITKAGGLTTYEAVARRLPMAIDMITEPMPQELGTAQIMIETGLAQPIRQAADIVAIVENLQPLERYKSRLPEKYNLNRVNSVYDIARLILQNASTFSSVSKQKQRIDR
jgi:processive 1,2-diacylglycerol beta-glucosyltransferase